MPQVMRTSSERTKTLFDISSAQTQTDTRYPNCLVASSPPSYSRLYLNSRGVSPSLLRCLRSRFGAAKRCLQVGETKVLVDSVRLSATCDITSSIRRSYPLLVT